MAITYKILGQSTATGVTTSTLYTVPAATSAIVSTLTICNQAATSSTFRVAVQGGGAALDPKHYINYNTVLPANDTILLTIGMTLAATDIVSTYASSSTVSFSLFGNEIT